MSRYLEEAAALLRQAVEANEERYSERRMGCVAQSLVEGRERIAMKFAQLGAVEAGLIPVEMVQDLLTAVRDGAR